MYVLFPGHKIFVANYHPEKAIQPSTIEGDAFFNINIQTIVVQKLSEKTKCHEIKHSSEDLVKAHIKYESWYD